MICHLKSILSLLDMTQTELADILDVHRNTVTNIMRHNTNFSFDLAYRILDVINGRAKEKGIQKTWTVEDVWEK